MGNGDGYFKFTWLEQDDLRVTSGLSMSSFIFLMSTLLTACNVLCELLGEWANPWNIMFVNSHRAEWTMWAYSCCTSQLHFWTFSSENKSLSTGSNPGRKNKDYKMWKISRYISLTTEHCTVAHLRPQSTKWETLAYSEKTVISLIHRN